MLKDCSGSIREFYHSLKRRQSLPGSSTRFGFEPCRGFPPPEGRPSKLSFTPRSCRYLSITGTGPNPLRVVEELRGVENALLGNFVWSLDETKVEDATGGSLDQAGRQRNGYRCQSLDGDAMATSGRLVKYSGHARSPLPPRSHYTSA